MGQGRFIARAAALAGVATLAAGCGSSKPGHAGVTTHEAAVSPTGRPVTLTTPGVPKGEQTVKLRVIATPSHATVALVPIWINGHGPYPFAVDTGAAHSLIDSRLVSMLGLHTTPGLTPTVAGVAGSAKGQIAHVAQWRAGTVTLPPEAVASLNLGSGQPAGLLGSDVLSRYGKIAIDYDRDLLILDPPVK